MFEPQARFDGVRAEFLAQRRQGAVAVDAVFGGAGRVTRIAEHGLEVLVRIVDGEQRRQAGRADAEIHDAAFRGGLGSDARGRKPERIGDRCTTGVRKIGV